MIITVLTIISYLRYFDAKIFTSISRFHDNIILPNFLPGSRTACGNHTAVDGPRDQFWGDHLYFSFILGGANYDFGSVTEHVS